MSSSTHRNSGLSWPNPSPLWFIHPVIVGFGEPTGTIACLWLCMWLQVLLWPSPNGLQYDMTQLTFLYLLLLTRIHCCEAVTAVWQQFCRYRLQRASSCEFGLPTHFILRRKVWHQTWCHSFISHPIQEGALDVSSFPHHRLQSGLNL